MKVSVAQHQSSLNQVDIVVLPAFQKTAKKGKSEHKEASLSGHKELWKELSELKGFASFEAEKGSHFSFNSRAGQRYLILGMGEKNKVKPEDVRRESAKAWKSLKEHNSSIAFCLDSFHLFKELERSTAILLEGVGMADYQFKKYFSKNKAKNCELILLVDQKGHHPKVKKSIQATEKTLDCITIARDLVNEPPNVLNSESYAKKVEADVRTALKGKGVRIKIFDKAALKKEKMDMFLSVNAGSAWGPRMVQLSYTPSKTSKKAKHIVLVGKGITFDTGGYSLKPGDVMKNMKFDMAGSATVYGAFRAAVLAGSPHQITCLLGMTDNAVNSKATMPDTIVRSRSGKFVEILNTDAEGRLVLGDCLDYACDLKPDAIIDAATLTGAILISLGKETCGLFSNSDQLAKDLLKAAESQDELLWRMPINEHIHKSMKSPNADLRNIGANRFGGSMQAAAFLENFIKNDIDWAHFDIAGVADSQGQLPYCPNHGASGLMVRTLLNYLTN